MGFFDKIKGAFGKIKEDNKGFGAAMKRMNSADYCGNVKGVEFWQGSYINIEEGKCLIYSSSREDYFFSKDDVESFEADIENKIVIAKGDKKLPGYAVTIKLKDGKTAKAEILANKLDAVKATLGI